MDVGVDEARHGDEPAPVDLGGALISLVGADDAVAGDGDVAHANLARGEVENADFLDHEVGRRLAACLLDDVGELAFRKELTHPNQIGLARRIGNGEYRPR